MLALFSCPVCTATEWRQIQQFRYKRAYITRKPSSSARYRHYLHRLMYYAGLLFFNAPYPTLVSIPPHTQHHRLRQQVLFECWFPQATEVLLTTLQCGHCGFMTYTPRPEESDLQVKYAFLQAAHQQKPVTSIPEEPERAQRIYRCVTSFLPSDQSYSVLDFGGADGRLMRPFLAQGHTCYLIDYSSTILPGVTKLGDELPAVPAGMQFELINCSHVLEHLANPFSTIQELKNLLSDDGIIYAEVPAEVWNGIRIEYDPVTHLNFFTHFSIASMFQRAGYEVLYSQTQLGSYGSASKDIIWLIARRAKADPSHLVQKPEQKPPLSLRPRRVQSLVRILRLVDLPGKGRAR